MNKKLIALPLLWLGIFSVALATEMPTPKPNLNDPYENYNRHAYKMNKKLDQVIFKPVATLYKTATPAPIRKGVNNFLSNLSQIPTVINDVLQGNLHVAGKDVARFAVNTTFGIGGFIDVATTMGLEKNPQDFGLTLAKWGYQSSNYFVLPILGPSTVRDAISWPVYYEMTVYPYIPDDTLRYTLLGLDFIDTRTQLLDIDPVIEQSFDPYVFERDAYLQRRNYLIRKNDGLPAKETAPLTSSLADSIEPDDTTDADTTNNPVEKKVTGKQTSNNAVGKTKNNKENPDE